MTPSALKIFLAASMADMATPAVVTLPLRRAPALQADGASLGAVYIEAKVGTPAQSVRLMLDTSTGTVVSSHYARPKLRVLQLLKVLFSDRVSRSTPLHADAAVVSGRRKAITLPARARAKRLGAIPMPAQGRSRVVTLREVLCRQSALCKTARAVTSAPGDHDRDLATVPASRIAPSKWVRQRYVWII